MIAWCLANRRLVAVVLVLCAAVLAGWCMRGMYQDGLDLAALRGADKAIAAAMQRESGIAAALETRLADLRANERVIEREKIKIIDRPVYRSECLDADGVRLINLSKAAGITTRPAGAVP